MRTVLLPTLTAELPDWIELFCILRNKNFINVIKLKEKLPHTVNTLFMKKLIIL